MFSYLFQGLTLGLSATASPGPFQAYLLSQSLKNGWKRTLPAIFGPLISDGPIILLALFVLTQVPASFLKWIQISGGFFLIYLAWNAFTAYRNFDEKNLTLPESNQQNLLKASLINALSPGPYMFWGLINGPILIKAWKISPALAFSFLAGFYATLIGGFLLFIIVFSTARQFGPRINRILIGVSSLVLLGFGLYQVVAGFTA